MEMYDFKLLNTEQRGEVFNLALAFQIRAVSQVSCHAVSSAALASKSRPLAAGPALLEFIITCFTAGSAPGKNSFGKGVFRNTLGPGRWKKV